MGLSLKAAPPGADRTKPNAAEISVTQLKPPLRGAVEQQRRSAFRKPSGFLLVKLVISCTYVLVLKLHHVPGALAS